MLITDILDAAGISCDAEARSKKGALEEVSELIASANASITSHEVLTALFARERLGTTGLGEGVAIPHARLAGLTRTHGVYVRLVQGIDYDAPDGEPVDLLFGLALPEESTDEHLQILSLLAQTFSNDAVRDSLRRATRPAQVLDLLTKIQLAA